MQQVASSADQAGWLFELGEQWRRQGQNREAIACYRQALERRPQWPEAHLSLGHTLLVEGDFEHGFEEMEWRWRLPGVKLNPFEQPLWKGEPLEGKRILLWAEQGFGDTIQFARFAAEVKRTGATVLLECQPALARLMRSAPGVDEVVAFGSPLPAFDVHAPLQRLPWILRTRLESIPAEVPYLTAEAVLADRWRERLAAYPGVKIGLVWSGNPRQVSNRSRSLAPELLAPLLAVPGVSWFSLQKDRGTGLEPNATYCSLEHRWGEPPGLQPVFQPACCRVARGARQAGMKAGCKPGGSPHETPLTSTESVPSADLRKYAALDLQPVITDLGPELTDFSETAAALEALDLLIAVDTAVAHLAGALGRPVWTLLSRPTDYRWLMEREDSPWYPTMRLLRQARAGDWAPVVARLERALRELASE